MEKDLNTLSSLMKFDPGKRGSSILYEYTYQNFGDPIKESTKIIRSMRKRKAFVVTGFPVKPNLLENDGPLGSIILSEALKKAGLSTTVGTYRQWREPLRAVSEEIHVNIEVVELQDLHKLIRNKESIIFFVEVPGSNVKGVRHNMTGKDISSYTYGLEDLLQGPPTIGIGDGGNELGMGKIEQAVRKHIKYGDICQCKCRSGIAAKGATDILIPCGTSNWGCYVLAKALGLDHNEGDEMRMLKAAVKNGFVDGVLRETSLSVDGVPAETDLKFLRSLNKLTDW